MEVIGRFSYIFDDKGRRCGDRTYTGTGFFTRHLAELRSKCLDYFLKLGVIGFEEYEDHSVKWMYQNELYSTEQIERILKIKAFT